jgi:integrase
MGLKEQVMMYLEWSDLSFPSLTLTVHSKPEQGFRIEDKEERHVPIPIELLDMLKVYRAAMPESRFVLATTRIGRTRSS